MKKLIFLMVFMAALFLTASMNSLQAHGIGGRPGTRMIVRGHPVPGYFPAWGYHGGNRGIHRQMWAPGYWARPRFYPRPAVRMRVW